MYPFLYVRKAKTGSRRSSRGLIVAAQVLAFSLLVCGLALSQAGRKSESRIGGGGVLINLVARRDDKSTTPITSKQLAVFDNNVQQDIRNLTRDPSPARIVLLVDNSLSIRADVEKLEEAAREFAYEIFDGDKLLIVGYDEEAEIVADWTDNAKGINTALKQFRKKGEPHLFDALSAVAEQALRPLGGQKRVVVVISDGLDRGSKSTFERIMSELQLLDVAVYCVQAPDRTRGAIRRDVPKPKQVIEKLSEGTGGMIFPIDQPREAAAAICDELRRSRYVLSYVPSSMPFGETRRLLVLGDQGITVRAKTMQPPN